MTKQNSIRTSWWKTRATAAGAAIVVLMMVSATPASAAGSFTMKIQPDLCTQTDYAGGSDRANGQARAYTYYNPVSCLTAMDVKARVAASGFTGPTVQGNPSVTSWLNKAGTPTGYHNYCMFYNWAWSCSGTKVT